MAQQLHGHCQVDIIADPLQIALLGSPRGKPFIKLTFPDGVVVNITSNLAELIGGIGAGVIQRMADEAAARALLKAKQH